jgi:RNA 2',3'-cyclic 3'-phosphodiesterase
VAVTPPPAVRERLHARAASLGHPALRVVPAENLHITVLFLGNVARDAVEDLTGRLGRVAAREDRFTLEIGHLLPGPPRRPYMLWALVTASEPLLRLSRTMHVTAKPLAAEQSKPMRGYGHITLARGKGPLKDVEPMRMELEPSAFEVTSAELIRSELSPRGARYETVAKLPLGVTAG